MTERVVIFRESGLRDDVTILVRARARELQVDQQVERAQQPLSARTAISTTKSKPKGNAETDKPVCRFFLKPDGCKNGDIASMHIPVPMGSESHNLQACARPRRQQSSRSSSAKPAPKKPYVKPEGKAADAQTSTQGAQDRKKVSLKARTARSYSQDRRGRL